MVNLLPLTHTLNGYNKLLLLINKKQNEKHQFELKIFKGFKGIKVFYVYHVTTMKTLEFLLPVESIINTADLLQQHMIYDIVWRHLTITPIGWLSQTVTANLKALHCPIWFCLSKI